MKDWSALVPEGRGARPPYLVNMVQSRAQRKRGGRHYQRLISSMVRGEDIYRPIIYLVREEQGIRVLPLRHFLLKRPTSKKQPGRAQGCDRPITLNSRLISQLSDYHNGIYRRSGAERFHGASRDRASPTGQEKRKGRPQGN